MRARHLLLLACLSALAGCRLAADTAPPGHAEDGGRAASSTEPPGTTERSEVVAAPAAHPSAGGSGERDRWVESLVADLRRGEEAQRIEAVEALADAGALDALLRASSDPSWRVRRVAADALGRFADARSARALWGLMADRSLEVQRAAIAAVAAWPDELATPLRLRALERSVRLVRTLAAEQLAAAGRPVHDFPIDGSGAERSEAVAALRRAWQVPAGPPVVSSSAIDPRSGALSSFPSPDGASRAFGDAVRGLRDPDVAARRAAAAALVEAAGDRSPSPEDVQRLEIALAPEPDALVWRAAFGALARDPSPPAIRIAVRAVAHPSGEVRRLGCGYLADHPYAAGRGGRQVEAALLAALEDDDGSVRVTAAEALGSIGGPSATEALAGALGDEHRGLQIAAAAALAKRGDERGRHALVRLSQEASAETRLAAVRAMGEVADVRLLPSLVAALDDPRLDVRRTAITSLAATATGNSLDPPVLARDASLADRVAAWRGWWHDSGLQ